MNFLTSRIPALRFLGTFASLQIGYTLMLNGTSPSILTIEQYMHDAIKEKTQFTIVGIIKPRSIRLQNGLNKKFIITDNSYDIKCRFTGQISVEFKQGQTAVVTGYCPDSNFQDSIIVKDYFTKHSMQTNQWQTKSNVNKNSYGLQSFR